MDSNFQQSWEGFLNPDVLRSNLITASIYIAAFELLKSTIVNRPRSFYTPGLDHNAADSDPDYQVKVRSKNRSRLYASLEWLKEMQAIDDGDIVAFEMVKKYRNDFAHAITKVAFGGLPPDLPTRFSEMVSLLAKIERWWIVHVEERVQETHEIIPGPVLGLDLMMHVALGPAEESRKFFDEFVRHTRGRVRTQ